MANDHRCRWIRHRLPLLAGGELGGEERRRVERHLIGCPCCRDRRDASEGVLSVLRAAAREAPDRPGAPSLWPALVRQIRESRHAAPRPSWWASAASRFESSFWPAMGLALGLGGLVAAVLPQVRVAPPAPTAVAVQAVAVESPGSPEPSAAPRPPRALPVALVGNPASAALKPIEPLSAIQYGYDLDHGTPLAPGARDTQHSY